MLQVLVALIPGIIVYSLLIDKQIWVNLIMACLSAVVFESLLLRLRGRPAVPAIKDASVVLATTLLVLSLPQTLPAWQLVFGVLMLCTLGKHVFGGLGHNPFNPAMVAYAILMISFPLTMTQWETHLGFLDADQRTAQYSDQIRLSINNEEQDQTRNDGITSATPLDRLDTFDRISSITETDTETTTETSTASDDTVPGYKSPDQLILDSDWLWISVAWLAGGIYLLIRKIISWHIPVAMLATLWILYASYSSFSSAPVLSASVALFSGALILGAFFIATDPVSAATSNPGKLIYGTGIGVLCFCIREFSAYPEGVAFAVLLMNMCVPLIDHACTRNHLDRISGADDS